MASTSKVLRNPTEKAEPCSGLGTPPRPFGKVAMQSHGSLWNIMYVCVEGVGGIKKYAFLLTRR